MKALRFEKYGPPSVLSIQKVPVPDLGAGEALVELLERTLRKADTPFNGRSVGCRRSLSCRMVDTVKLTGSAIAMIMNELRAGFEGGYLRTSPVQKWSLDQAVDAYAAVEKGTGLNKHVFLPCRN
jgi:hypothetical protein